MPRHDLQIPGYRRVRISCRTPKGETHNRYVSVYQTVADTEQDVREKASTAYRERWGDKNSIICIDI